MKSLSAEKEHLSELVDYTNKQMEVKFKRKHEYGLLQHQEQLSKDVYYDTTKGMTTEEGNVTHFNTLKK